VWGTEKGFKRVTGAGGSAKKKKSGSESLGKKGMVENHGGVLLGSQQKKREGKNIGASQAGQSPELENVGSI